MIQQVSVLTCPEEKDEHATGCVVIADWGDEDIVETTMQKYMNQSNKKPTN